LFGIQGFKTDWGNSKLEYYASKLADSVSNYQEKVTDLIEYLDKIDVELSALDRCQYKGEVITQILGTIQKTVDQMSLNNYSNLSKWIENLDKTVPIISFYCVSQLNNHIFSWNPNWQPGWRRPFTCGPQC